MYVHTHVHTHVHTGVADARETAGSNTPGEWSTTAIQTKEKTNSDQVNSAPDIDTLVCVAKHVPGQLVLVGHEMTRLQHAVQDLTTEVGQSYYTTQRPY